MAAVPGMEDLVAQLARVAESLAGQAGQGETTSGLWSTKPMTSRTGWSDINKYTGKSVEYGDWKFQLLRFVETEDKNFQKFMMWLDRNEVKTNADIEAFGQDARSKERRLWCDDQLYAMLSLKCAGDALTLVRSVPDDEEAKGAKAWKKIVSDQEKMNALKMDGLIKRIFDPERVSYKELTVAVETW